MARKIFLQAILMALVLCSISYASPVPPAKGQWAYPLESYSLLYSKANRGANNQEIELPERWISVPSATRDSDNYLWYSVNVDGHKGWLPQNGIRLKMGGKSKIASNLYKTYAKARSRIISRPRGWSKSDDGSITSYTSNGGEFRVIEGRRGVEDVYFQSDDPATCKEFLGVDLIRLYQSDLRKKMGTPTMRESPQDDIDVSILSYELSDRNMTLAITLRREDGDTEGRVEMVELYRGRTGEPED